MQICEACLSKRLATRLVRDCYYIWLLTTGSIIIFVQCIILLRLATWKCAIGCQILIICNKLWCFTIASIGEVIAMK